MFGHTNEPFILTRDVETVIIPAGEVLQLREGTSGFITQSLGGSFTIYIEGNLFRIAGKDADAIGKEVEPPPEIALNATDQDIIEVIWSQLRTCYDPEIPINIVELGLIYECGITPLGADGNQVDITMTLTSPGCGMGDYLADDVRTKILALPNVTEVSVNLTFEPPWNYDMMSEAAKLETGMF